jgi:hypothetical protein
MNSFVEVEDCCSVLRAFASSKNSVACSFYVERFVRVAPTVISWNTQQFCCKPDILQFDSRLWRNRLLLPTNVTSTPDRMQPVPWRYRLAHFNLTHWTAHTKRKPLSKISGQECSLSGADEYVWWEGREFWLQYEGTPFEFLEKFPTRKSL